jgi:hypothetical protein
MRGRMRGGRREKDEREMGGGWEKDMKGRWEKDERRMRRR